MVTKSKYISLTIIILIVFVMFQFVGNSVGLFFSYDSNEFDSYKVISNRNAVQQDVYNDYGIFTNNDGCVVIIGEEGTLPAITQGCEYLKIKYRFVPSFKELDMTNMRQYAMLVVATQDYTLGNELTMLNTFVDAKIPIIFAVPPKSELVNNSNALRQITGIQRVYAESVELDGITIFSDFFLGGKAIYEKVEKKSIPYYWLLASAKAYVVGILDDQNELDIKNERLPHLVWRNTCRGDFIFVMNYDFFESPSGIGFFTAMLAEMAETFVYPVINAQTIILENFPPLTQENTAALQNYYSQTSEYFMQMTVWPSIVSLLDQTDYKPSCYIVNCFDENNSVPSKQTDYEARIEFYVKQIKRQSGELGISAYELGDENNCERIVKDLDFFEKIIPEFTFTSVYCGNADVGKVLELIDSDHRLTKVNTVVIPQDENGNFGKYCYLTDDIVQIPVTGNGYIHSDDDNIALKSLQTALAASNLGVDAENIIYPQGEQDDWVNLGTDLARFTYSHYWYTFKKFDRLSVTKAADRVRNYLSLTFSARYEDNKVYIEADNFVGDCYFILRTQGNKILEIENADFSWLEEDMYLLTCHEKNVTVTLAKTKRMRLY